MEARQIKKAFQMRVDTFNAVLFFIDLSCVCSWLNHFFPQPHLPCLISVLLPLGGVGLKLAPEGK